MQHGKNGGVGAAQLASWWNTAFVTLLFMMAAKWMSTAAIANEKLDNEVADGNLKPNCSTDWTVLPISRGGNEVPLCWTKDVPSRCPMMTVSTRSSWLLRGEKELETGTEGRVWVCKYMNNGRWKPIGSAWEKNETCVVQYWALFDYLGILDTFSLHN